MEPGLEIVEVLDPEDEIIAYAREHDVDWIALGRRHRPAVDRLYVGSTTSAVIYQASCPVLVVPPQRLGEVANAKP